MTSALINALASNLTDQELEDLVGHKFSQTLFGIVVDAGKITTNDQKDAALQTVAQILTSPILAAMSVTAQFKLKKLCSDAKELIEMDADVSIISPEELRGYLENKYPINAVDWGQATDEVRDLCRYARGILGLGEGHAVNFRALKTPANWNLVGINGIINFYNHMDDQQKEDFVENNKTILGIPTDE
jgi:hypothetical protein